MRVAYISYEHLLGITAGGIETYLDQITELMSSRGHEVEVFTCTHILHQQRYSIKDM
jgi:glycogen(starch) synthase